MKSQVFKDEVLTGTESADQPAEEMSERRDHDRNHIGKVRIELCAKPSFCRCTTFWRGTGFMDAERRGRSPGRIRESRVGHKNSKAAQLGAAFTGDAMSSGLSPTPVLRTRPGDRFKRDPYCAFTFWKKTSSSGWVCPEMGSSTLTGSVIRLRKSPHPT
jgi:hypothetical protein